MGQDERNLITEAIAKAGKNIADATADTINSCGVTFEECFPVISYKSVKIDGVVYDLKIKVTLMKRN